MTINRALAGVALVLVILAFVGVGPAAQLALLAIGALAIAMLV